MAEPDSGRVIGRRVPRKEDRRLLLGIGRFGSDIHRERMLHARFVRSALAAGRLVGIDTESALAVPGVVGVFTADDLDGDPRIPVRIAVRDIDLTRFLQPVLARDVVRYVGEPVAVVVATDAYAAEDGADAVFVDVEPTDVHLSAPDVPDDRVAADFEVGFGDVDAAFSDATHVVELHFDVGRHTAVPMEPRCLLAEYDPATETLDIHGSTKVPVFNQHVLADLLHIDVGSVHTHVVDAGGGFGVRGEFYPEDFVVPWLAKRLRRPVMWVEDRSEHLMTINHSRQQHHDIAVALDADGTILGLRDDVWQDNGAYIRTHGVIVPELTVTMFPGPYRVPAYHGRARVGLTHKTPCGTYRAPGRFEGTVARESLLDRAALAIGIDRIELRRRNLITRAELPLERDLSALGTPMMLDDGDYRGLFDRALARADELGWPALVEQGRADGRRMGLGVASFLEKSGLGPQDTADVMVTSTGRLRIHAGATSLGQGVETALAQICADAFGMGVDDVDVVTGDTWLQPYGTGSWASRSTVMAGNAVRGAAEIVRARIGELSARLLEASPDDVEVTGGVARVRGVPGRSVTFADVWRAAQPTSPVLGKDEPAGLSARHRFEVDHMTYPYGTHVCVVEVDPGTGGVSILKYLVAYEIGRAVNPMLVEGQLRGGVAQGIGGALLEEFRYDEAGQPQSTSFLDYLMPTAHEVPDIDVLISEEAPAGTNGLGVRGAGEGGLTASGAAIASGVADALGIGSVSAIPLTPARVVDLADGSRSGSRR